MPLEERAALLLEEASEVEGKGAVEGAVERCKELVGKWLARGAA